MTRCVLLHFGDFRVWKSPEADFLRDLNVGRHAMGMNHDIGVGVEGKRQRYNFLPLNTRVRGRIGKAKVKEDS